MTAYNVNDVLVALNDYETPAAQYDVFNHKPNPSIHKDELFIITDVHVKETDTYAFEVTLDLASLDSGWNWNFTICEKGNFHDLFMPIGHYWEHDGFVWNNISSKLARN